MFELDCPPLSSVLHFTPRFQSQPLSSRTTDYLWSRAQTDRVQDTINTAAIISASSNAQYLLLSQMMQRR